MRVGTGAGQRMAHAGARRHRSFLEGGRQMTAHLTPIPGRLPPPLGPFWRRRPLGPAASYSGPRLSRCQHRPVNGFVSSGRAAYVRWNLTDRLSEGVGGLVWDVLSGGLMDGFSVSEKVWGLQERGEWDGKTVLHKL